MAPTLPSGTVTFVFTDIEGSTRLFHRLGSAYAQILDRHRRIVRDALASHAGIEMSVEGDSFFAVFERPDDALRASLAIQRGLAAEEWGEGVDLRVRIGIHSGLASPRDGNYVALAVHQASRVMAAGHGGQVLVSEETVGLLSDATPLKPIGRYRLRDFDEPQILYQTSADGPDGDFPAVRAVPADRHNLTPPLTPTVGRAELVAEVIDAVRPGRLVTLIGPGGVGKTRVAVDVSISIAPDWDDGVWRVDLAEIPDGGLVTTAIGEAIGVPRQGRGDALEATLEFLQGRSLVIFLDNCEHVVEACRQVSRTLLSSCPAVAILATSREPMRVPGERQHHVPPLSLAEGVPDPETLVGSAAGRLFVDRARSVAPGFEVTADNVAAIDAICRRLDGLPLFLELAAAQLAFQTPEEILAGLEGRFRLLRSHDPSRPRRHRTAEALLGWSYRLLDPAERTALRRLSVFGAGFSLETATPAIAGVGGDPDEVAELVWSLVDRSLAFVDPVANATRYRLLETVRAFGRSRLAREESQEVAVELGSWFLDRLGPWLPADRKWVGSVRQELGNLRAILEFLPPGRTELAQTIACVVGRYHDASQTFREGIEEIGRYVETYDAPSPVRVGLLTILADLYLRTGDVDSARALVESAELMRRTHGAPEWDDVGVDRSKGEIARRSGDFEGAVAIAEATLGRSLTDRGRSRMLNLLGTTSAALGDLERAYAACAEELELNKAVGYEGAIASAEGNLAEVAMRLGDLRRAAEHQRASLELAVAQGSSAMVAFSLIVAARIAGSSEDWSDAVLLQEKAGSMLSELGLALYEDDAVESERLLARARDELGGEEYDRLGARGASLDTAEAVRMADGLLEQAAHPGG